MHLERGDQVHRQLELLGFALAPLASLPVEDGDAGAHLLLTGSQRDEQLRGAPQTLTHGPLSMGHGGQLSDVVDGDDLAGTNPRPVPGDLGVGELVRAGVEPLLDEEAGARNAAAVEAEPPRVGAVEGEVMAYELQSGAYCAGGVLPQRR